MKRRTCHDCDVIEGQIHKPGCDMECCPFCGHQLIGCECCYEKLDIDASEGTWAWSNGLTEQQGREWEKLLKEKGHIPYIAYPNLCCRCGELRPNGKMYPDEEWEKYIEPNMRGAVMCDTCFQQIKEWIDNPEKGEQDGQTRKRNVDRQDKEKVQGADG